MLDTKQARIQREKRARVGWKPMALGLTIGLIITVVLGVIILQIFDRTPAPGRQPISEPQLPPAQESVAAPSAVQAGDFPQTTIRPSASSPHSSPFSRPLGDDYGPEAGPLLVTSHALAIDRPQVIEAREILKSYRSASTIEQKQTFVFEPDRAAPLMKDFYERQQATDPAPMQLLGSAVMNIGEEQVIHLTFACTDRLNALGANFRRTPGGRLLLDWESFVGYSGRSWAEFKSRRTAQPTMFRAHASLDRYHNFEFDDPARFLSVKFRSPDGNEFVNGYCEKNSGLGTLLQSLLTDPGGRPLEVPITAMLAFPPQAKSNHCVWIRRFIASRWVLLESDLPADASTR